MEVLTMFGELAMKEVVLENLFREYYTLVYRSAFSVTRKVEDAEDVVQTIFLRLILRKSPPDLKRNPKAYLYRAAVNLSLNAIRSRKRHTLTLDPGRIKAQDYSVDAQSVEDAHRRLCNAIDELSPVAVNILTLRYEHGWSDAEIAKLLGTSRGAVAVRLHRLRARLRRVVCAGEG